MLLVRFIKKIKFCILKKCLQHPQFRTNTHIRIIHTGCPHKTGNTFLSSISRAPEGPISNGLTFFNSPFNVDFRNILDFGILSTIDKVIAELVEKDKNDNQNFRPHE